MDELACGRWLEKEEDMHTTLEEEQHTTGRRRGRLWVLVGLKRWVAIFNIFYFDGRCFSNQMK
jgi:hypothetical protein